jgi:hypothetical protein
VLKNEDKLSYVPRTVSKTNLFQRFEDYNLLRIIIAGASVTGVQIMMVMIL